jgi:nucleoside-diphosphate-sugar epimerase
VGDGSVTPYEKSKTLAERSAWAFVDAEAGPELVTILPGAVLGPMLSDKASTSIDLVRVLMLRSLPGCPRLAFNLVDVRDVACAHVAALEARAAAGQRFLCALPPVTLAEIADILHRGLGPRGFRIPQRPIPDWVMRIGALFDPTARRTLPFLGKQSPLDTSKTRAELGWRPRSVDATVLDTAESLLERGLVAPP